MKEEAIKTVADAGVVGAGGAGFPTHVKLNARVDTVIVNGAECEPMIQVDRQLMEHEARRLIVALNLVMDITSAERGVIGLKKKYKDAIASLENELSTNQSQISLFYLDDFYPAGDEQILVFETTRRIVPEGGIPLDVNTVVINVETLLNVLNAFEGYPVVDKYVTITGYVNKPITVKVPLGISLMEALNLSGGVRTTQYSIITGGPVMGHVEEDLTSPITKTTKGLIALPNDFSLILSKKASIKSILMKAKMSCCQCVACTDICPRYLLGHNLQPHRIMRGLGHGSLDYQSLVMAQLCSECGACEVFACPMGLSPRRVNREIKLQLRLAGVKPAFSRRPDTEREFRVLRRIPVKRMITHLGLTKFDIPAPLDLVQYQPKKVRLPLTQHIGAPSIPLVKPGDKVARGQLIAARPAKGLGANVHASIDGIVVNIDSDIIIENLVD